MTMGNFCGIRIARGPEQNGCAGEKKGDNPDCSAPRALAEQNIRSVDSQTIARGIRIARVPE